MWSSEDLAALWGWTDPVAAQDVIPIDERCWRCDARRIHEKCAAGLCEPCCTELRASSKPAA